MFVCVFDASRVYSITHKFLLFFNGVRECFAFHVGKVDQGSNDGFDCFASYSRHLLGIFGMLGKLLMHAVIMLFVNTII